MSEQTLEVSSDIERQLVTRYSELDRKCKNIQTQLEVQKKERDEVEEELLDLLKDEGKTSSARFEGIGHVTCIKPRPQARVIQGQELVLFDALKKMGRGDLIKTSVNASSLTSLVRQRLEEGSSIPEGSTYYIVERLQFYPQR